MRNILTDDQKAQTLWREYPPNVVSREAGAMRGARKRTGEDYG